MGGLIELVAQDDYFTYYIDEEGLLKDLDRNVHIQFERVARCWGSAGFPLGKVIMVPNDQEK